MKSSVLKEIQFVKMLQLFISEYKKHCLFWFFQNRGVQLEWCASDALYIPVKYMFFLNFYTSYIIIWIDKYYMYLEFLADLMLGSFMI